MTVDQVLAELAEIGNSYHTVRGLLNSKLKDGTYVGQRWATLLQPLDGDHRENVCHEYATFERPLPERVDQLAASIMWEVKERMHQDAERLRVYELRQQARKAPWRDDGTSVPVCVAVRYVLANGPLPDDQVEELCRWDRGGPMPEFIKETTTT